MDGSREQNAPLDEELTDEVYRELRQLAAYFMKGERRNHTLQPTALVHEALLRIASSRTSVHSRSQLLAVASVAIRRVLVDHARGKQRIRRGRGVPTLEFTEADSTVAPESPFRIELIELDEALIELEQLHPRQARIIELRFFGGLSVEETSKTLGISQRSAFADWEMARRWLKRRLAPCEPE